MGHVLGSLPIPQDPNLLVGAATRDDAAVYRIAGGRALVATVDFFTPIVDDPHDFGAVAAANSVSDVYAMGGRPMFALSIVGFPRDLLDRGVLEQIVAGGAAKLAEAGCPVVGGHSIDDAEPKFGYAVIGEVDPERMITAAGARAGDLLYLTKPLGSGLAATAIKRGACPPELEAAVVRTMASLNRAASAAMVTAGASAATDVTGYGLAGHAATFGVGMEIELSRVPLLPHVRDLADQGGFPDGSRRNYRAVESAVDWTTLSETDRLLACDAQTSGGLLVAIAPERAEAFESALGDAEFPAARIGRVTGAGAIRFRP